MSPVRRAYSLLGILFLIVGAGAYLAFEQAEAPVTDTTTMSFTLSSPAFEHNGAIPSQYTCDGAGVSPELHVSNVPSGTQSLVLVMDDPDIPAEIKSSRGIEKFDHFVLYNIPPDTIVIPKGKPVGTAGINSAEESAYRPPCPPSEYEPREHRYIFRLYALSGNLNFVKSPTLDEVEQAAQGMTLDVTELIGRYQRQ